MERIDLYDELAQDLFGRNYDELDYNERTAVFSIIHDNEI